MSADVDFMQYMDTFGVAYQIVLTKGDFVSFSNHPYKYFLLLNRLQALLGDNP